VRLLRRLYDEEMPRWLEPALTTGEPFRDVSYRSWSRASSKASDPADLPQGFTRVRVPLDGRAPVISLVARPHNVVSIPALGPKEDIDKDFCLRAEVPGITPNELSIAAIPNRLSVAGKREYERVSCHRKERADGSFNRTD
jgi:hypothetical protein